MYCTTDMVKIQTKCEEEYQKLLINDLDYSNPPFIMIPGPATNE